MLWFKHIVNSTSDPDFMEAELKFKANGPYVFWRTLEILAREDALDKPIKMPITVFKSWFPVISKPTLLSILDYYHSKNRLQISYDSLIISIFCDKLSLISSNYTKKVRREAEQKTENIPPRRENREEKIEKKEEKKKTEAKASPLFNPLKNLFFNEYFRLTGKDYIGNIKDYAQLKLLLRNKVTSERMYTAIHNCYKDEFHRNNFSLAYVCANFSKLENWKPKALNYFQQEQADSESRKKKKAEVEKWKKEQGHV